MSALRLRNLGRSLIRSSPSDPEKRREGLPLTQLMMRRGGVGSRVDGATLLTSEEAAAGFIRWSLMPTQKQMLLYFGAPCSRLEVNLDQQLIPLHG